MLTKLKSSPILARVIPFAIFAALTLVQNRFGDALQYWIYAFKTALGAWMLWQVRPSVKEMRWNFSWEALVVGVAVFLAWVGLEGHYPFLVARSGSFNPNRTYGAGSVPAMTFVAVRVIGSSLIVPPLEEVFYRSFLYRYMIHPDFMKIRPGFFNLRSFLFVGLVFGAGHYEWLPGILCAFAYQALVCRKDRLGDAIAAHAITNALLALWIVLTSSYYFW